MSKLGGQVNFNEIFKHHFAPWISC